MRSFRHYSKNFKPTFCWFTLLYTLVKSSVKNAQIKFSHFYHCVLWSRMLVSCDVMALFFLKEKWTKKSSRKKKDENALEYFHSSFRHFIQFTFFPATFKYNFKNWLNLHTNILLLFRILYQRIIIDIILTWLTSAFYPFARSLSLSLFTFFYISELYNILILNCFLLIKCILWFLAIALLYQHIHYITHRCTFYIYIHVCMCIL